MEIKNLINKLHHSPSSKPQSFLALYLTDDTVQLAVWQLSPQQSAEILQTSQSVNWDGSNTSSLVQAVNQALDQLSNLLPPEITDQLHQIIFGLPSSWVGSSGDLLDDKKTLLKDLCHQLDLKPLGFALLIDSLLLYLQHQEGNPLNALVLQVSDLDLTLYLVQHGKIQQQFSHSRTDDFLADFNALLRALTADLSSSALPNRILLFNGHHDLHELGQLLQSQDWQSDFPFLHLPQIETLAPDIGIRAIALAGGTEIAKSLGLVSPSPAADLDQLGFALDQEPSSSNSSSSPPHSQPPARPPFLSSILTRLRHLKLPRPRLSFPSLSLSTSLIVPLLLFLSLLFLLAGAIWFLPQASLTLYLKPKTFQTEISFIADPHLNSPDIANHRLPVTTASKQLSAEKTIATTGEGLVGEKATGQVTIYNRTTLSKTFPAGTPISANRLRFTLSDSVTIASKSTAADYTETPGKTDVAVIAADIGEEYNLPANTEFRVANFSPQAFIARNSQPFTGGSAQRVRQVSSKDKEQLFSQLLEELKQQLRSQANSDDPNQIVIIPDEDFVVVDQQYSADVGQPADQLTLKLTLKLNSFHLRKQDVLSLAATQLSSSIPSGFYPLNDSLELVPRLQQLQPDGTIKLDLGLKLKLLPQLDTNSLKRALKGLPASQLSSYFHSHLDNFDRAELKLTPSWLPPRLKRLPFNPDRIHLTIQAL